MKMFKTSLINRFSQYKPGAPMIDTMQYGSTGSCNAPKPKTIYKKWTYVIFVVFLAVLFNCGLETAGGSSTIGNARLACTVKHSDGTPAACANVKIRPVGYLAYRSSECQENALPMCFDGTTDSKGTFSVDSIHPGTYKVEIIDNGKAEAALVECTVRETDTFIGLDPVALETAGAITGKLITTDNKIPVTGNIYMYGLEREVRLDTNGTFVFEGLAPGSYVLHYKGAAIHYESNDISVDTLISGENNDIGTINVTYTGCTDFSCDSLMVRQILDVNDMDTVQVNDIIKTDTVSQRIISVNLQGMSIHTLPGQIGNLRMLKELYLNDNALTSLPAQIGYLHSLRTLSVSGNNLSELPTSIGLLDSLQVLSLERNNIQTIPRQIGSLQALTKLGLGNNAIYTIPAFVCSLSGLQELYVNGNKLSGLPENIGLLENCRVLVAGNNFIDILPSSIGALTMLKRFDVNDNWLTTVPSSIGNLTQLEHLLLNANRIAEFPEQITALTNVQELSIDGNKLCGAIDPEIEAWITMYSTNENWKGTQCK